MLHRKQLSPEGVLKPVKEDFIPRHWRVQGGTDIPILSFRHTTFLVCLELVPLPIRLTPPPGNPGSTTARGEPKSKKLDVCVTKEGKMSTFQFKKSILWSALWLRICYNFKNRLSRY